METPQETSLSPFPDHFITSANAKQTYAPTGSSKTLATNLPLSLLTTRLYHSQHKNFKRSVVCRIARKNEDKEDIITLANAAFTASGFSSCNQCAAFTLHSVKSRPNLRIGSLSPPRAVESAPSCRASMNSLGMSRKPPLTDLCA